MTNAPDAVNESMSRALRAKELENNGGLVPWEAEIHESGGKWIVDVKDRRGALIQRNEYLLQSDAEAYARRQVGIGFVRSYPVEIRRSAYNAALRKEQKARNAAIRQRANACRKEKEQGK